MNEFAQPQQPPTPGVSRDDLVTIAKRQRAILVCIFLYLVGLLLRFAGAVPSPRLFGLVMFIVGTVACVCLFGLAMRLYGIGPGIALGILTLVPFISLIVLLVVNSKATKILTANGVKVGLLGADPSKI